MLIKSIRCLLIIPIFFPFVVFLISCSSYPSFERYGFANFYPNIIEDWVFQDDLGIFAVGRNGFGMMDVSNKNTPRFEGIYETDGIVVAVDVQDDQVFVLNSNGRLHSYVLSEQGKPELKFSTSVPVRNRIPRDLLYFQEYLFVANSDSGLEIFEVQEHSLTFVGNFHPNPPKFDDSNTGEVKLVKPLTADQILIVSGVEFTADNLYILDISNIEAVQEISHYQTNKYVYDVLYEDEVLYVSSVYGLEIVDLSNILLPTQISTHRTKYKAKSLTKLDNSILLADLQSITVVDVSNLESPREIERLKFLQATLVHAFPSDQVIYVYNTADERGIHILNSRP